MKTFLKEIANKTEHSNKLDNYNHDIFSKHIDLSTLNQLLDVSKTYLKIITVLNKRTESIQIRELERELKNISYKVSKIKYNLRTLSQEAVELAYTRNKLYGDKIVNLDLIKKITTLDNRNSLKLAENDIKLSFAYDERRVKKIEYNCLKEEKMETDKYIEKNINNLNESLTNLIGKNVYLFDNLDSLKEQYEKGLKDTIKNKVARKTYTNYLFDVIQREGDILVKTKELSQQFIANSKKEENYKVNKLNPENNQIVFHNNFTETMYNEIKYFSDILCCNKNENRTLTTTVAYGYNDVKVFIDSMYKYIDNIPEYSKNIVDAGNHYNELCDFNNSFQKELYRLSDKSILKNIPFKQSSNKGKRETYKFVLRAFNSFDTDNNNIRLLLSNALKNKPTKTEEPAKIKIKK